MDNDDAFSCSVSGTCETILRMEGYNGEWKHINILVVF